MRPTGQQHRPHLHLVAEPATAPEPPAAPGAGLGALLASVPDDGDRPDFERDLAFIDQVLAIQPVPQDVMVWRAAAAGSFELPWRDLAGTLHQEPSYLAVALVRYPALTAAEAVLHLRVPAGVPGVYLNPFDHGDRLPAPTLLLGRGLALFVHEVRRQDGQWYLRADLVPPPPPGWGERRSHPSAVSDAGAPRDRGSDRGADVTAGASGDEYLRDQARRRMRPEVRHLAEVREGLRHGR